MSKILDGLDSEQLAAVTAPLGIIRVSAGPGSGKTRVLTHRIAYRCSQGSADAQHVMAATFSRQAAREIKLRLIDLNIGAETIAGTFHGIALAQLTKFARDKDRKPPELLMNRGKLLQSLTQEKQPDILKSIGAEIDWLQARCLSPEDYPAAAGVAERNPLLSLEEIAEVAARYSSAKRHRNLFDFNDLLERWTELLCSEKTFAAAQRWRFRHFFVDEMQDLTPRQVELMASLVNGRDDLFVVGDTDQSIYSFAGATPDLDLATVFPGIISLHLQNNYRCSPEIVEATNGLAKSARKSIAVHGPAVSRYDASSDSAHLVRSLLQLCDSGFDWKQMAVLSRSNAQVNQSAKILKDAGIPSATRGQSRLTAQPGITEAIRTLTQQSSIAAALHWLRAESSLETKELSELESLLDDYRLADPSASPKGFGIWLRLDTPIDLARDAIHLTTFHAAKGLEWPAVVLFDCRTYGDSAEEKRLLYVAMTRAAKSLTMLNSRTPPGRSDWLDDIAYSPLDTERPIEAPWKKDLIHTKESLRSTNHGLLESVLEWRDEVSRAARVLPESVLSSERARKISDAAPSTIKELAALAEWGPALTSQLGEGLLKALNQRSNSSTTGV